ncbi:DegT/DnrJ/EryC1/StrS family aminotransferase [Chloroflexota bacterium]
MIKDIELITLRASEDIKEAMQCIDKAGVRIVLIVNEDKKLIGVATDGDIRRAILAGKNLSTPISEVMHADPVTAQEGTTATELLEVMHEKDIYEIPIVDTSGSVVDIVLLPELKTIPLSSPDITHKEVEIINQVLSTPYLSIGPKIRGFEERVASYIGTKYAIAVNSGTSALHLCIRSLGIKDGDEVISAPFSFIASANCILFDRAKPIFVDIDKNSLCIDPDKIEEKITGKTKAILPVHIFGHPCQMDKIMKIASDYNLAVIEDACEAIGAEYKGKKVGSFGDCGVFGFYPNKQITTAEGGMIITNNEKIAKLCRSMRNQGRDKTDSWLSYSRLGYNYRMSELSASLGIAQIDRIDEILEKRQKVAELYNKRLGGIEGIKIPSTASEVRMSWFIYVIRLDEQKFSRRKRDKIIQELRDKGIDCRDYFPPIHLQPFYVEMFGYEKGSFPITEKVSSLTIALPFYNNLAERDIHYICDTLEDIMQTKKV